MVVSTNILVLTNHKEKNYSLGGQAVYSFLLQNCICRTRSREGEQVKKNLGKMVPAVTHISHTVELCHKVMKGAA